MILHLVDDEKFTDFLITQFESILPNQSIYYLAPSRLGRELVYIKKNINKLSFNFDEVNSKIGMVDKIFVHFLSPKKASIANELKKTNKSILTYWIFYGADLYLDLDGKGVVKLYDYPVRKYSTFKMRLINLASSVANYKLRKEKRKFIAQLDYFCFWNYYDYKLMINNYKTQARYKYFAYGTNLYSHVLTNRNNSIKSDIIINNSAAQNGNHLTIINSLKEYTINSRLIFPLNYGNKKVRNEVIEFANTLFKDKCLFLLEFMDANEFFKIISNVKIGIFGYNRQKAGNVINYLLGIGSKVILRDANSMLMQFRDFGYVVYSFEEEVKNNTLLEPIPADCAAKNMQIFDMRFEPSVINKVYLDLVS